MRDVPNERWLPLAPPVSPPTVTPPETQSLPGSQQAGCHPTLTRIKLLRDVSALQCLGNKEILPPSPQAMVGQRCVCGRVAKREHRCLTSGTSFPAFSCSLLPPASLV